MNRSLLLAPLVIAFLFMPAFNFGRTISAPNVSADWPMYRFDPEHDGATPEAVYPPLTPKWNFTTDTRPLVAASVSSAPSVAAGVVYFGSENGNMYALDASTGALKWNYTTGGDFLNSAPAVAGGLVYVGNDKVYAFDALTGAVKWSSLTGVESSPVVSGKTVYVGSYDSHVYALDAVTGALKWAYLTVNMVINSPAILGGLVYVSVTYATGKVYALNATSGALVWTFNYTSNPMTSGVGFSGPAASGHFVYVGGADGNMYALNATTGTVIWSHSITSAESSDPAVSGGLVYVVSYDGKVNALNARTGELVWSYDVPHFGFEYPPTVSGDILYVSSKNLQLYALNATNGAFIWSGTVGRIHSPVVSGGFLYLSSEDNVVYALSGQVSPLTTVNATTSIPLTASTVTLTTVTPLSYTSLATPILLGVLVTVAIVYLVAKYRRRGLIN